MYALIISYGMLASHADWFVVLFLLIVIVKTILLVLSRKFAIRLFLQCVS